MPNVGSPSMEATIFIAVLAMLIRTANCQPFTGGRPAPQLGLTGAVSYPDYGKTLFAIPPENITIDSRVGRKLMQDEACPTYVSSGLTRLSTEDMGLLRLYIVGRRFASGSTVNIPCTASSSDCATPCTGGMCEERCGVVCSATLIDPTHAVTAGHCFSNWEEQADGPNSQRFIVDFRNGQKCLIGVNGQPPAVGNAFGTACRTATEPDGSNGCPTQARAVIRNFVIQHNWYVNRRQAADAAVVELIYPAGAVSGRAVPTHQMANHADVCNHNNYWIGGYPATDRKIALCDNTFGEEWYRNVGKSALQRQLGKVYTTACVGSTSRVTGNYAETIHYRALTCGGMSGGQLFDSDRGRLFGVHVAATTDFNCATGRGVGCAVLITDRRVQDPKTTDANMHIGVFIESFVAELNNR